MIKIQFTKGVQIFHKKKYSAYIMSKLFKIKKLLAFIVCGVITLNLTFAYSEKQEKSVQAKTVAELQEERAENEKKIEQLQKELKKYDEEDIFVVGGSSVYEQLLPYCDTAHITRIDYAYQADAYFPNLDAMSDWELTADSDEQTYFDLEYYFLKYQRKK